MKSECTAIPDVPECFCLSSDFCQMREEQHSRRYLSVEGKGGKLPVARDAVMVLQIILFIAANLAGVAPLGQSRCHETQGY